MSKNKKLVIVESPGKCKKIQGFLGNDYVVMASFGHICDLKKNGIDKKNNFEPSYEISKDKKKIVNELKGLAKKADEVYLCSDLDREGEAIAYHLKNFLNISDKKAIRVTFSEITKKAIEEAFKNPRKVDMDLVNSQQARRILDRLVGFEVSPVLWSKVKMGLSAGRVQSVALKIIVEREKEIKKFDATSKFKTIGMFEVLDKSGKTILIKSTLDKTFKTKDEAIKFLEKCIGKDFFVKSIEKKPSKKTSSPPFTTSTLQQEASRKISFSVDRTMKVAQKLYEAGHITYMRTDSVNLSDEASKNIKNVITNSYGKNYSNPKKYKTKSSGAQEAHEAIRPTNVEAKTINGTAEEQKLYELIWKRTVASQMSDAQIEKTIIKIGTSKFSENFIAKGEFIKFDGFLKLYQESVEDKNEEDDENGTLPELKENQKLNLWAASGIESYNKPPARFSEPSLVKKLEELGIGRPSTYASIISTIQKREYVVKENRPGKERTITVLTLKNDNISENTKKEKYGTEKSKMFPTDIGIVVSDFLADNFDNIMDYQFTANAEKQLDEIANGNMIWTDMLSEFYNPLNEKIKKVKKEADKAGVRELGKDPSTNKTIIARIGRYGPMIQMGNKENGEEVSFAKLKKEQSIDTITLEEALELLKWPRKLGKHKNEEVTVAIGKYGPYIKHDGKFYSIKEDNPETIVLKRAVEVISEEEKNKKTNVIKEFSSKDIKILNGKYGPYISHKRKNYKIPPFEEVEKLTLKDCLEIIKKKKQ